MSSNGGIANIPLASARTHLDWCSSYDSHQSSSTSPGERTTNNSSTADSSLIGNSSSNLKKRKINKNIVKKGKKRGKRKKRKLDESQELHDQQAENYILNALDDYTVLHLGNTHIERAPMSDASVSVRHAEINDEYSDELPDYDSDSVTVSVRHAEDHYDNLEFEGSSDVDMSLGDLDSQFEDLAEIHVVYPREDLAEDHDDNLEFGGSSDVDMSLGDLDSQFEDPAENPVVYPREDPAENPVVYSSEDQYYDHSVVYPREDLAENHELQALLAYLRRIHASHYEWLAISGLVANLSLDDQYGVNGV